MLDEYTHSDHLYIVFKIELCKNVNMYSEDVNMHSEDVYTYGEDVNIYSVNERNVYMYRDVSVETNIYSAGEDRNEDDMTIYKNVKKKNILSGAIRKWI